ncbi:CD209 antigen-like protein C isoform X2 [Amia ocellicauda]|uniref:CD209 antigen-like protein C isoform X2 n=1 Tax=Amia ocellicauda TaxID=2972642 RepID=UPI00346385AC
MQPALPEQIPQPGRMSYEVFNDTVKFASQAKAAGEETDKPGSDAEKPSDSESLKAKFDHLSSQMNASEGRYKALENKYTELDGKFNAMEEEMRQLNKSHIDLLKTYSELQTIATEDSKPCPEGWELSGGMCYFFSTDKINWTQSRKDCVKKGGELVIIHTWQEQMFLKGKINKMAKENYWIGLTDAPVEGEWMWVDNTTLRNHMNFWAEKKIGSGEPDDWTEEDPLGEDCACMNSLTEPLHNWFDESCTKAFRRICEKKTLEKPK